jgi:hypothetical protein
VGHGHAARAAPLQDLVEEDDEAAVPVLDLSGVDADRAGRPPVALPVNTAPFPPYTLSRRRDS